MILHFILFFCVDATFFIFLVFDSNNFIFLFCRIGVYFCPLLALIVIVKYFLMFYIKKVRCHFTRASERLYELLFLRQPLSDRFQLKPNILPFRYQYIVYQYN